MHRYSSAQRGQQVSLNLFKFHSFNLINSPKLLCVCLQGHQLHHVCFILPNYYLRDVGSVYLILGYYGCVSLMNRINYDTGSTQQAKVKTNS